MGNNNIGFEIFDRISEVSGIRFKFKKISNKKFTTGGFLTDSELYAMRMSKIGYGDVFFVEPGMLSKPLEMHIARPVHSEIPLEKYAIAAIMDGKLEVVSGKNLKTGKNNVLFRFPKFETTIELKMKVDLL